MKCLGCSSVVQLTGRNFHIIKIAKIYEFAVVSKPFRSFCISVCPECIMFFFILIKRTCKVTTKLRITIRVKILNLYSPVFVLFQELLDMKTLTWYWIIYRNPIQLNDSDQHCPWVVHLLICEIWCQRQGVESRGGS